MKPVSRARRAAEEEVSEVSEGAAESDAEAPAAAAEELEPAAGGAPVDMAARRGEGRENSRAAVIGERGY
jgi:hypothetical protein